MRSFAPATRPGARRFLGPQPGNKLGMRKTRIHRAGDSGLHVRLRRLRRRRQRVARRLGHRHDVRRHHDGRHDGRHVDRRQHHRRHHRAIQDQRGRRWLRWQGWRRRRSKTKPTAPVGEPDAASAVERAPGSAPKRGYNRLTRAVSSVGRAPARQAGGHWFDGTAHFGQFWPCG